MALPIDRPEFRDLVCFNFYLGWRHIQSIYRSAFPAGVSPQRAYLLGAGGSFFFNSSLPHSYRNVGTSEARVVWMNSHKTRLNK